MAYINDGPSYQERELHSLLAFLIIALGQPHAGLATNYHYAESPDRIMRDGSPFENMGRTCAVDAAVWEQMRGRTLLVVSEAEQVALFKVTDTGYLARAGEFVRRPGRGVWTRPTAEDRALDGKVLGPYPIVIDIPQGRFEAEFGTTNTQLVWVWAIESAGQIESLLRTFGAQRFGAEPAVPGPAAPGPVIGMTGSDSCLVPREFLFGPEAPAGPVESERSFRIAGPTGPCFGASTQREEHVPGPDNV